MSDERSHNTRNPVSPRVEAEILANEGDSGDGERMEDSLGEAQEARIRRAVYRPSPEEVQRHERTHHPWRPWCEDCVAGMARDWPHSARDVAQHEFPEMHFDYCFPRDAIGKPSVPTLVGNEMDFDKVITLAIRNMCLHTA